MATRCVTLELTSEQTDAIKTLFQQHDWKYCEMKSTNGRERNGKRKRTKCVSTAGVAMSANGDGSGDQGNQNDHPDPDGDNNDDSTCNLTSKCIYCFMSPCVTVSQHHLGGEGQGSSEYNPPIRKSIYNRFWRAINNLGGWSLLSYQNKKREQAQRQNIVYWKREIMPECVLSFARGLYPNPDGQPYIGHKWE